MKAFRGSPLVTALEEATVAIETEARHNGFREFVDRSGSHLRLALISAYGPEVGAEATADALAYGWEHWDRLATMGNPQGYLYRVGQTSARKYRRRPAAVPDGPPGSDPPWVEPDLHHAMQQLTPRQRAAVVLVRGYGYRLHEVGELLGVSPSTVERHIQRGVRKLREALEVHVVT
jgi:DNA-directed RNA polymerase specialized sigma24 family protein